MKIEERTIISKVKSIEIIYSEDQKDKRMKKNKQCKEYQGHHQAYQHTYNGNTRRKERKTEKKTIIVNFSNMMKSMNLYI